jgi:zinc protease
VPRHRSQEPPQRAERRLALSDQRVSEPYVYRTYLAPGRKAGDQKPAAALAVLAELLGGSGTTSVLSKSLAFGENAVATYSSADYDGDTVDDGLFSLFVMVAKFLQDGVDPDDLERIKAQIRAADIYARDDSGDLAQMYGSGLATGLTRKDIEDWPQILQSVSAEDVMAAARQVLERKNAVTGWLQAPEGAEQKAEASEIPPALEGVTR